jgi:D-alanine-D-alanine ligase
MGSEKRLSVAVIHGGPSTEAEVSRASSQGVTKALAKAGHPVVSLPLDSFLPESLRTGGYDVAFPVAHGAVGEDGSLQGLLEVIAMPYVGSDVTASALAMHKRFSRALFKAAGLPVARGMAIDRRTSAMDSARIARREVGERLVVKPSSQGSAVGVVRLDGAAPVDDVARAIEAVWEIDEFAIVEHFARGLEITCAVLDLGEPRALPVTEIRSPRDPFYTYEARYAPGRSVHVCPAALPDALTERVQRIAVSAHELLGCRDLSRVDFIVGDDADIEAVTLLEVNTLPGMTATSLYPEAAAVAGLTMPALCDALARHAHARGVTRRLAPKPLPR